MLPAWPGLVWSASPFLMETMWMMLLLQAREGAAACEGFVASRAFCRSAVVVWSQVAVLLPTGLVPVYRGFV